MPTKEELLKQAQELNEAKKYNEVIDLLNTVPLKEINSAELYAELAQALYRLDQKVLSEQAADNSIAIAPVAKAYHYKGNAYWEKKIYTNAIQSYQKAIQVDPKYAYPFNGLGNVYYDLKIYDEALKAYQRAIELSPESAYPFNGLGNTYYILKNYDEAINAYKKAIEVDRTYASPYNGLGNVYSGVNNYDEALRAYQKAIEIDPKNSTPYNGLGTLYFSLKKYQEAIQAYNSAIAIDPRSVAPFYNLALLNYDLGKYKEALKNYEHVITLTKNEPDEYSLYARDRVKELRKLLNISNNKGVSINSNSGRKGRNGGRTGHHGNNSNDVLQWDDNRNSRSIYDRIVTLVDQIKSALLYEDDNGEICITHYTALSTAKKTIFDKSPLRLSEGAFLNDTSEGKALYGFLSSIGNLLKPVDNTQEELFAQKPFIGSYVPARLHDDLMLWRTYGKDNKEDAKGCSITLDGKLLLDKIKDKLIAEGKIKTTDNTEDDYNFYHVAYRTTDEKEPFFIPNAPKNKTTTINDLLKKLKAEVELFMNEKSEGNMKHLLEVLNRIAYLFKNALYQKEEELRLVLKGIHFTTIVDKEFTPPWVYIELVDIVPLVRKITFGPKVEKRDEWASAFYYQLINDSSRRGVPLDIYISHLPFK